MFRMQRWYTGSGVSGCVGFGRVCDYELTVPWLHTWYFMFAPLAWHIWLGGFAVCLVAKRKNRSYDVCRWAVLLGYWRQSMC